MEYRLEKITDLEYDVLKDGRSTYRLRFKNRRWSCTCQGFVHRGSCKHVSMLPAEAQVERFPREFVEAVVVRRLAVPMQGLRWEPVGSYRRKAPTSKDLDVLVLCTDDEWLRLADYLSDFGFTRTSGAGRKMTGEMYGIPVDIDRVDDPKHWAAHLLYRTGPRDLNVRMRQAAKEAGFTLNERFEAGSEREIFEAFGFEYLEPEDRK